MDEMKKSLPWLLALLVGALIWMLSSVLFWVGLVLVLVSAGAVIIRLTSWAWAGVEQARLKAAQRRLVSAKVAEVRAHLDLIPEGYVGARLRHPAERDLFHVWTYKQEVSPAVVKLEQEAEVVEALPPALPGPTDLLPLLSTFRPDPTRILLALNAVGMLTCSLEGVSHVALAAPTGGGKSSIMRLLLAQMLFCGAHVWLADPHYTPLDPKTGEDWRMIEARLAQPPFTKPTHIAHVLAELVKEMYRRYDLRHKGQLYGDPCYLAIDEWPAILNGLGKDAKETTADVITLLRQARKVDMYVITSSQDFLVETIGTGGEVRANLRTAYFAGGGIGTARALLDQKIKLPEEVSLGKGLVMLRSEEAQPVPALVRVPYASNDALYRLLPLAKPTLVSSPPIPRAAESWDAGESFRPDDSRDPQDSPSNVVPLQRHNSPASDALKEWERKFIAQRYRAKEERTAIRDQLRDLRGSFSNRLYGELKAICDAIDAEQESDA